MSIKELLAVLFPHLAGLGFDGVFRSGRSVRIHVRTGTVEAQCPACGCPSRRVHSRYVRQLCDMAINGQETIIHLQVRRFFCHNESCPKKTFAEQVPGLTSRYGRHSLALRDVLRAVALALAGRAPA
ncbi:transposase family protein [Acrocarpospora sp. B8E8]|uniref:transposase family protein n=1 Tax=Acrocarpospora sp. B8E8 TaxID=3153572 RepID=UPI00325FB897